MSLLLLLQRIQVLDEFIGVEFYSFYETDYFAELFKLQAKYGVQNPIINHHKETHVVLSITDTTVKYIGDVEKLISIAEDTYNIENAAICNTVVFNREVREELYKLAMPTNKVHPIVYLEFDDQSGEHDTMQMGKIFIELYTDVCPKACDNFIKLCTAGNKGYIGTTIHRIVKKGWFQCGDVVDSSGANSISANDGEAIPDESFSIDFGCKHGGIVGYSNSGPHSNGSQFFITLGPCDWMNGKFVGIGRVIQGWSVFKDIESVEVSNQVPSRKLSIAAAGMGLEVLTGGK